MKKGVLTIISGFSGAGKGTVVKELLKSGDYCLSISATTRNKREGDKDGVDYFFKTKEEFEKMIENDELIEYASYVGNYYGTPKAYVLEKLNEGKNVILEIEMQGALKVKEKFPDAVTIFITPDSFSELDRRLHKRGTETEEAISNRLSRAKEEIKYVEKYDYLVFNNALEDCIRDVDSVIKAAGFKVSNMKDEIKALSESFNA